MSLRTSWSKKKVFGVPLNKISNSMIIEDIPIFLTDAAAYIMDHIVEGIFRIPGERKKVDEMKRTIEKKGDFLQFKNPIESDVHCVSSVMLSFLRDLPEPLIPFVNFSSFIECSRTYEFDRSTKDTALSTMINTLHFLVNNLPLRNKRILAFYMNFFFVFSIQSEVHKMRSENLAVCIAPSLLHSKEESFEDSIANVQHQTLIATMLIKYYPLIFKDVCSAEGLLFPQYHNISKKKKEKIMTEITNSMKNFDTMTSQSKKQKVKKPKHSFALEIKNSIFSFDKKQQTTKSYKRDKPMKPKLAMSTRVANPGAKLEQEKMKSEVMKKRPKSESFASTMIFVGERLEEEMKLPKLEYKQLLKKKKKELRESVETKEQKEGGKSLKTKHRQSLFNMKFKSSHSKKHDDDEK